MRKWLSIGLLFVCMLSGCARSDASQAKRVVDGYMKQIQKGDFAQAKDYCSKAYASSSSLASYQDTIDTVAKENNYSEKEKEAFAGYVNYVVQAQYAKYSFEEAKQAQDECIVILKVEGVSAEALSTIDVQTMEKDLKQEIFNTQSEEYIITYFETLIEQVKNLPKSESRSYFVLEQEEGQWKIVSMVNES